MGCSLVSSRLRSGGFAAVLAAVLATGAALAAMFAAARTAPAASPEGMLLPGEKVRDTLSPDGETRIAGFAGLAGMRCTFVARALPKSRVTPTLAVTNPAGVPVELGRRHKANGGRATVSGLVLGATGNWRVSLTTPSDHGGAFELSAAAKAPTRVSKRGVAAGDPAAGEVSLDALPGTTLSSLTVTVTSKPKWTPTLELVAPDGTSLGATPGKGVRATMKGLALESLGGYRVIVTGGAGKFTVAAKLRPPRRAPRTWQSAESRPEIRSVSPLAVQDDGAVDFTLEGVGFSTSQTLRLVLDGATKYARRIDHAGATGAIVAADLPSLVPGDYTVEVGNAATFRVVAADRLVVRNRAPGVVLIQPRLLPNGGTWNVDLRGAGFDVLVQAFLRRASDGLSLGTSVSARTDHETLSVRTMVPSFEVGTFDLEVRDPDGSATTVRDAIEVIGWRAAPTTLSTYTGLEADTACYATAVAYDPVSKRACVALRQDRAARWILVDTVTWTVVGTYLTGNAAIGTYPRPGVAWNAATGQWALTSAWFSETGTDSAYMSIRSGSDLSVIVKAYSLGEAKRIQRCEAAADPVTGHWIVVHDRWDEKQTSDGEIWALAVDPYALASASDQVRIATGPYGIAAGAAVGTAVTDRFVVAYLGWDVGKGELAIRKMVLNQRAETVLESVVVAGVGTWDAIYAPHLAPRAEAETMLLGFSYLEKSLFHPASVLLEGSSAAPGDVVSLDGQGARPQGFVDCLTWNAARQEFVAAMTVQSESVVGVDVAIRRISPGGLMLPAQYLQRYEGTSSVVWAGPEADTLGFGWTFDGEEDGTIGGTGRMEIRAGPMR